MKETMCAKVASRHVGRSTQDAGCSRQGWRGADEGEFLPLKSHFVVKELNGKG